jgi:alkylhydroperoxidase family enzyme
MSQRLRGISDEEASGVVKQVFDTSNQLLGRTANLLRILAHSPYIARWFLPLVAAVRQPRAGAVSDVRLRNLAVLKTSTINGCKY